MKLEKLMKIFNGELLEITIGNKVYKGIFVEGRIKKEDREKFEHLSFFELRKEENEDEVWMPPTIDKHVLVNFWGTFIIEKEKLRILQETDIEDINFTEE